MARLNVLHVVPFDPRRSDSGGHVRIRATVDHLSSRSSVHLVHIEERGVAGTNEPAADVLTRLRPAPPAWTLAHRSRWAARLGRGIDLVKLSVGIGSASFFIPQTEEAQRTMRSAAASADVVVIELSQLAGWRPTGTPSVLVLHDLMWRKRMRFAANRRASGGLRARADARRVTLEARVLERLEPALAAKFDALVVVSEADADVLREALPAGADVPPIFVSRNGVDSERFSQIGPPRPGVVGFVGGLDHPPNADAVRCLVDEIEPVAGAHLRKLVLGGRHTEGIRIGRIRGLGAVPDIRAVYELAMVMVAPVRWGSGSRLKIIEAAACGRPTVAFPEAAEGLEDLVECGAVVVVASAAELATATEALLADPERCTSLGEAGRSVVVERYDWRTTLQGLDDAIECVTVRDARARSTATDRGRLRSDTG